MKLFQPQGSLRSPVGLVPVCLAESSEQRPQPAAIPGVAAADRRRAAGGRKRVVRAEFLDADVAERDGRAVPQEADVAGRAVEARVLLAVGRAVLGKLRPIA